MDINRVVITCRLTRDAELKSTPNGQAVAKFPVAVNRKRRQGDEDEFVDEVSFFDIVLWGKQAETLHQYLVKGKAVAVDGELRQDRWQQDGQNRSKVEIVANHVQLLGGGQQQSHGEPQARNADAKAGDGFADSIPF